MNRAALRDFPLPLAAPLATFFFCPPARRLMAESIHIQCPNGHLLELDLRDVGKHVKCPMCQMLMVVPASNLAAPATLVRPESIRQPWQDDDEDDRRHDFEDDRQDEDDEEESTETPRQVRIGLRKVRTGLNYHIAKIYVYVVGFLLVVLFIVAGGGLGQLPPMPVLIAQGWIYITVIVTGIVLDILTYIHLAGCPERTRARGLAIAYIVLEVIASILHVMGLLQDEKGDARKVLSGLGFWVFLAGYVCIVLFLKRLAVFLNKKKLAAKATGLLVLMGVSAFCILVVLIGSVIMADAPQPRAGRQADIGGVVVIFLGFLGFLISMIWSILRYLRLIHNIRDAL
jgi:hypothetical protein